MEWRQSEQSRCTRAAGRGLRARAGQAGQASAAPVGSSTFGASNSLSTRAWAGREWRQRTIDLLQHDSGRLVRCVFNRETLPKQLSCQPWPAKAGTRWQIMGLGHTFDQATSAADVRPDLRMKAGPSGHGPPLPARPPPIRHAVRRSEMTSAHSTLRDGDGLLIALFDRQKSCRTKNIPCLSPPAREGRLLLEQHGGRPVHHDGQAKHCAQHACSCLPQHTPARSRSGPRFVGRIRGYFELHTRVVVTCSRERV